MEREAQYWAWLCTVSMVAQRGERLQFAAPLHTSSDALKAGSRALQLQYLVLGRSMAPLSVAGGSCQKRTSMLMVLQHVRFRNFPSGGFADDL
jgi:hypothetical protein